MIELFDQHGRKLASGTIVPDRGKLRVPAHMMDAAPPDIAAITRAAVADAARPQAAMHRPGFAPVSMADRAIREQALAARDARQAGAWRNPPAVNAAQTQQTAATPPASDPAARRDAQGSEAGRKGGARQSSRRSLATNTLSSDNQPARGGLPARPIITRLGADHSAVSASWKITPSACGLSERSR